MINGSTAILPPFIPPHKDVAVHAISSSTAIVLRNRLDYDGNIAIAFITSLRFGRRYSSGFAIAENPPVKAGPHGGRG